MALVIEDGSRVAGANSYVTLAEARAFASARGVTLSAVDATLEPFVIKAFDYVESLESKWKGGRIAADQPASWPRQEVYLFDSETALASTAIPAQLKNGQCQLVIDAVATDLQPRGTGREIIKQKVDVIETEYAKTGNGSVVPEFNKAMAILEPLFNARGLRLSTLRV